MFAALLLGMSRCVSSDLCPDDASLIAAVQRHDNAVIAALSAQAAADNPGDLTMIHSERSKGISDVICGDRLPGDLPMVICRFTVRYWSRNAYQTARLRNQNGIWEIDQALAVTREQK